MPIQNNRKRKILCITGTRADYPRVKSVLKEITNCDSIELSVVVTGSHLLEDYGYSVQEIIDDGLVIDKMVPMFNGNYDTPHGMVKAVAKCTEGIADVLVEINPDLVLLTVDRVETLAAAVAVSLMNFPIAHIQGGEVTGTIDESIRHAVTKLSHIHFPATKDAANRIIKMGEDPQMVFEVGCPYIDVINNTYFKSKDYLSKKYKFNANKKIIIFTQHPVTTEYGQSFDQVKITIDVLRNMNNCQVLAFYSNTDAGGKQIVNELKKQSDFNLIPNMDSSDFLGLMNCADVMVGNSSAGIREAPSFCLPAVNIGSRQQGRLRAQNVIDVDHSKTEITKAINKALYDKNFIASLKNITNPYGDGKSALRIVKILKKIELTTNIIQKKIFHD